MILCVALNAALDVTYRLQSVRWHSGNRVTSTAQRAGGKAINAARVLATLGEGVVITGIIAGETGELIRRDLAQAGLHADLLTVTGESRRTVTIVDASAGDATGFWEPGLRLSPGDWERLVAHYRHLLGEATAVILSGSVPGASPDDAYAQLITIAHDQGVPAVLDADGAQLLSALPARPEIIKPNAEELETATGQSEPSTGADLLRRQGAGSVVVSLGADGLLASTPQGRWKAVPPVSLPGNPTGAGDACVAALARTITHLSWPERLAEAVALSASAVVAPLAGDVDLTAYRSFRASAQVEEM